MNINSIKTYIESGGFSICDMCEQDTPDTYTIVEVTSGFWEGEAWLTCGAASCVLSAKMKAVTIGTVLGIGA